MPSNSQNVITVVKRRKSNLIKVFGGRCCLCGFDAYQEALEFHHVNPEEKEFGITRDTSTTSLEKQLQELKKCILVCSNCHRGIHDGYLQVPKNWKSYYNEEIANQLIEDKWNVKHNLKTYCRKCGKLISKSTFLCENCQRESPKENKPNRELLKSMIKDFPFTKIGEEYGVTDNAIRKWCKAYNLPYRRRDIENYTEEEWEKV